jgi:hypothetical protein
MVINRSVFDVLEEYVTSTLRVEDGGNVFLQNIS